MNIVCWIFSACWCPFPCRSKLCTCLSPLSRCGSQAALHSTTPIPWDCITEWMLKRKVIYTRKFSYCIHWSVTAYFGQIRGNWGIRLKLRGNIPCILPDWVRDIKTSLLLCKASNAWLWFSRVRCSVWHCGTTHRGTETHSNFGTRGWKFSDSKVCRVKALDLNFRSWSCLAFRTWCK